MNTRTLHCLIATLAMIVTPSVSAEPSQMGAPPTLYVVGFGSVTAPADLALIEIGVNQVNESATVAHEAVSRRVADILDELDDLGANDMTVSTKNVTVNTAYDYPSYQERQEGKEPVFLGFRATNSIHVRTHDIESVFGIVDTAIRHGATKIERVHFTVEDLQPLRRDALVRATRDAREQADAIAEAMGVQITGIIRTSAGGNNSSRMYPDFIEEDIDSSIDASGPRSLASREIIRAGTATVQKEVGVLFRTTDLKAQP